MKYGSILTMREEIIKGNEMNIPTHEEAHLLRSKGISVRGISETYQCSEELIEAVLYHKIIKTGITKVCAGDYVLHCGKIYTVGDKDIKFDSFIGLTLFGDSYALGSKPVFKVIYTNNIK